MNKFIIAAVLVLAVSGCKHHLDESEDIAYRPLVITKEVAVPTPCDQTVEKRVYPAFPKTEEPEHHVTWLQSTVKVLEEYIRRLSAAAVTCGVKVDAN